MYVLLSDWQLNRQHHHGDSFQRHKWIRSDSMRNQAKETKTHFCHLHNRVDSGCSSAPMLPDFRVVDWQTIECRTRHTSPCHQVRFLPLFQMSMNRHGRCILVSCSAMSERRHHNKRMTATVRKSRNASSVNGCICPVSSWILTSAIMNGLTSVMCRSDCSNLQLFCCKPELNCDVVKTYDIYMYSVL